ncbi:MAG: radical SAM protein [uncultured bacterium]|nr:MAG: radical SAM protein [uncultured bacterium]
MLKLYKEHPEFDEFTKFDTKTGKLVSITGEEFKAFLPEDFSTEMASEEPIQKIETEDATIFMGETSGTHTKFPRRIYFQITRNCNLECSYCFIKAKKGAPDVPTKSIFEIAEFMGQYGLLEVRLTGGEPTIHPDFFDIVHKFKQEGIYVSVATNGLWGRKMRDELSKEEHLWIICSIDGPKEIHERYRPGTFNKIMENLKTLKNRNPSVRIRLTTVLTRENMNHIYDLGAVCQAVDAESITVIPLRPQVRDPNMVHQMVKGCEFKRVIEDLIRATEDYGIEFTTTMETNYKDKIFKDPIVRKRSSCAAGREATNLDYNAAVEEFQLYACSYSPAADLEALPVIRSPFLAGTFHVGNISKFLDIWRDDIAWQLFRDLSIRSEVCQVCKYLKGHQCTGSCPIQNVDLTKINVSNSVLEQLAKQIRGTSEWYCYQTLDK